MKKLFLLMVSTMLILSCNSESNNQRIVPSSSGNINSLSVVVDNLLWEDTVGEAIREVLGAPVYGLPQEEPLFSLKQMPPQVFTGFATKNRTVLKIEKGKPADTKFLNNTYARPQAVVLITGNTNTEIIDELRKNSERIISMFKKTEINEKQRRINLSLHKNNNIEKSLGLTIDFPSAYRIATEDEKFFWLRKDIKTGTMNLLLYELPPDVFKSEEDTISQIIKIRDSIGKQYVPGPIEGSYMITEEIYTPFMNETIIDNKATLETKSTWEVKNAFMAGPFINYVIEDKQNNRFVVAEGFVFAPSADKRDHVFELESIIRSLRIK